MAGPNSDIASAKVVVFLGAGASHKLGFPTTEEFLDQVGGALTFIPEKGGADSDLLKPNSSGLYERVIAFNALQVKADAEYVLDYLNDMLRWLMETRSLFNSQKRVGAVHSELDPSISVVEQYRNNFHAQVIKRYATTIPAKTAYNHFGHLINTLRSDGQTMLPVFTTNYDQAIEALDGRNNITVLDAFGTSVNTAGSWTGSGGLEKAYQGLCGAQDRFTIPLLKLHGSVNWVKTNDSGFHRYTVSTMRRDPESNLLIYPSRRIKELPSQSGPLALAYDYLRRCLSNASLCIVIGFSFRDDEINRLFSRAITKNAGLRLIVQDPRFNLANFLQKMREIPYALYPVYDKRIASLDGENGYFGKNLGNASLVAAIECAVRD